MLRQLFSVLAVCAGGLAQGISGFGFSLVSVPIQILLFGAGYGVKMTNEISIVVNIVVLVKQRSSVRWRDAIRLVIPAVLITPLAAWIAHRGNPKVLGAIAGIFTMLVVVVLAKGYRNRHLRGRGGVVAAGAVSSLTNTLFAVGGPAVAMFAVNSEWTPAEMRGTFQVVFIVLNLLGVAARGTVHVGAWFLASLIAAIVGTTLIGIAIANRMSPQAARRAVLAVAFVGGLAAFIKAIA